MTRSSSRKTAAKARDALKKVQNGSDDDDEGMKSSSEEEEYVRPPPRKQAKTSRASTGRRNAQKGAMSGFMLLPLEVVTQVCESLDLKTLFYLSTLNRRFFGFLRDASLSHLWEDARKTSGLPDLEAPMPPHKLAHLLFGSYCSICGKSTTVVDYILRIRACKACSEKVLKGDDDASSSYISYSYAPQSCRDSHGRSRGKWLQRVDELEHIEEHFCFLESVRADAQEELESDDEWEEPTIDLECANSLCTDMGDVTLSSLRMYYEAMRAARSVDGYALIDWQVDRAAEVQAERQAVMEKRAQDIAERFKALGWHPHYFDKPEFAAHSLVAVAKELDHATWMKIRTPLEDFLEQSRDAEDAAFMQLTRLTRIAHRKKEFVELATDKAKLKALRLYPLPRWADFTELETVKSLFVVDSIDEAYATAPTIEESAHDIGAELVEVRTALKHDLFEKMLVQLRQAESAVHVPSDGGETGAPTGAVDTTSALMLPIAAGAGDTYSDEQVDDIMSRAYSIFKCDMCKMIDHFPRILGHMCKAKRYYDDWDEAQRPPFKATNYSVKASTACAAVAVIDSAGLPRSVKANTMDDLGATFSCLCKFEEVGKTWLQMLKHVDHPYPKHEDLMSSLVHESLRESRARVFSKHVTAGETAFGERGDIV
ncbi:hypothetical protein JCM10296v2_001384 [Rhodotorula toruloides]